MKAQYILAQGEVLKGQSLGETAKIQIAP